MSKSSEWFKEIKDDQLAAPEALREAADLPQDYMERLKQEARKIHNSTLSDPAKRKIYEEDVTTKALELLGETKKNDANSKVVSSLVNLIKVNLIKNDNPDVLERFFKQRYPDFIKNYISFINEQRTQVQESLFEAACEKGNIKDVLDISTKEGFEITDSHIKTLTEGVNNIIKNISKETMRSEEKIGKFLEDTGIKNIKQFDVKLIDKPLAQFFQVANDLTRKDFAYRIQEFLKDLLSKLFDMTDKTKYKNTLQTISDSTIKNTVYPRRTPSSDKDNQLR